VAASPAVASPQEETATDDGAALDLNLNQLELVIATYNQLCISRDWAELLELELEMSAIAKSVENNDPSSAGRINFMLGNAHK